MTILFYYKFSEWKEGENEHKYYYMKRAITAAKQYTNKSIAHYSLFCFSLLRTYKMLNLIGSKRRSFY